MTDGAGLLGRLFGGRAQPDGQAAVLQQDSLAQGSMAAAALLARPALPRAPQPDSVISAALAQKVLHGWLQNLHQTRYPLVLNVKRLSQEQQELLAEMAGYALGSVDPSPPDVAAARAWLLSVGATAAPSHPACPATLVARLHEQHLAPEAYAICAGTLRRHTNLSRKFLEFLAARLGIPDEIARSLNRRFAN